MRNKRLVYNTVSALGFQVTALICGFILPRLLLRSFGSEVNGLVNSVSQFLNVIAFLEFGVGSVVQSSLYEPLEKKDYESISKIIVSADRFFKRLARLLLLYIGLLILLYPRIAARNFGWAYTAALIVAMSLSFFSQYYFGVVDRLLLTADQHGFVQYTAQMITLILNTAACVILIRHGATIHMVKLTTSLLYFMRPLFLRIYIRRNYRIDRHIVYTQEPIRQKWNGLAQHISAVVVDGVDNIVLTVFSTLQNVSIYSVYNLIVYSMKQLFVSMTNGLQALVGALWAKQELDELKRIFGWSEWLIHTGTVFVFGCTGTLILPFIQVYTKGITDADYIRPVFAVLIVMAHAGHCLRLPYNIMILAGGHYKQTQGCYIIAVVLNITISVAAVGKWGLAGVAAGTMIAMLYQTVWMAGYVSRNLVRWPVKNFARQMIVNLITVLLGAFCSRSQITSVSYPAWILLALKTVIIWGAVIALVNTVFYREKLVILFSKVRCIILNKSIKEKKYGK